MRAYPCGLTVLLTLLASALGAFVAPRPAAADAPALIAVQGLLTDEAGVPVTGRHRLDLALYSADRDGDSLYATTYARIDIEGGQFVVYLGEQPGEELDFALFRDTDEVWLEVVVDGTQIIAPRTRLGSVAYAAFAQTCGDATTLEGRPASAFAGALLGEVTGNPAGSCAELLAARPDLASGVYWLRPSSAPSAFQAYCDMTTDGGGWTLVWSNLRGGRGKPTTELQFASAINTLPRFSGMISTSLEAFNVYTGLAHWDALSPAGKLRYAWSADYGRAIDQMETCDYSLDAALNYTLAVDNCVQNIGSVRAGLFTSHNGIAFSAYDRDNDTHTTGCANLYSETPFWYYACWNGSLNGGGEDDSEASSHRNGAYWTGSANAWGDPSGTGGGNGWLFVR